jgi:hypothetical protein
MSVMDVTPIVRVNLFRLKAFCAFSLICFVQLAFFLLSGFPIRIGTGHLDNQAGLSTETLWSEASLIAAVLSATVAA